MAKDWNRRLSEAITLVKTTAPAGFTGDRQVVVTALERWNRVTAADQCKRLSELMSQDGVPNRPSSSTDRGLRRAAILLHCAIVTPDRWEVYAQIAGGNGFRVERIDNLAG